MKISNFALRLISLAITLVLIFSTSGLSALGADESDYVAEFRISTDKASVKKDEDVKVSVHLKNNYYICTMSLAVIYNCQALTLQNTSESIPAGFLSFSGSMADTYNTNGNWKSPETFYTKRNSDTSFWSQEAVRNKYKIVYATWSADTSLSSELVVLSEEEEVVSFVLRANDDIEDLSELIFMSLDFQKTASSPQGILFVGRSTTKEYAISSMVNVGQTITYNGVDPTEQERVPVLVKLEGTVQSFGGETDVVTLKLCKDGKESICTVTGKNAEYVFGNIESGTYTLEVSKENHATRIYEVNVNGENITHDVKIHLIGDINGDGKVNTLDVARVNTCARGVSDLSGYEFACADTNGDGKVNTLDVSRINAHARSVSTLW